MKARIIEQPVMLYSDMDISSPSVAELAVGSEVEIGGVKKKDGKEWVSASLPSGERGYVPGDTRIYIIKPATLLQENVNVYAKPSAASTVKSQYNKNDQFDLINVVTQDNKEWVKVRDSAGNEGFIEGDTKIRINPEAAKATQSDGGKNMVFGALWCIGGIIVTAATYSHASSEGGGYVVAWGAIIFGAWQFLKGLYQSITASK
jgi:hypothetical protein